MSLSTLFARSDTVTVQILAFPTAKKIPENKRSQSINDMKTATTLQLKTLTKDEFKKCFKKWQEQLFPSLKTICKWYERLSYEDEK